MSKKLVDHLINTNYNGIKNKIDAFRKPKKKAFKNTRAGNSRDAL